MNKQPNTRARSRSQTWVVTIMLATLGMIFSLAPSASSQVLPATATASLVFSSIGGDEPFLLISPSAVLHTPEGEYVGHFGLSQFGEDLDASFSDVEFDTQSAVEAGGMTIVSFTFTGVSTGTYRGVSASCAGVSIPGVAMIRTGEIGIEEQWISYNGDALASQIAAFNEFDPSSRTGCDDHVLEQSAPVPVAEPAPSCRSVQDCRLPY
jgi:hypothetical protein